MIKKREDNAIYVFLIETATVQILSTQYCFNWVSSFNAGEVSADVSLQYETRPIFN